MVLGDPGAGKTTLTRWLATAYLLRLKQEADWEELPDVRSLPDRNLLPIIVWCRDLDARAIRGSLADLLEHTLRKDELANHTASVQRLLRHRINDGSALLILDGLDEIADARLRIQFCEQIKRVARAHQQLFIVVTSRIVGYREIGARLIQSFDHLTLVGLEPEEKDAFARSWCFLTERPERREAAALDLIKDIHSSDRIERLTGNPMLLTTMALVRRKVGRLPQRRADLYWEAVQVLLNWRSELDEPLDQREAVPQLEYLAFVMCNRGVQLLREDEVVIIIEQMRQEFPHVRPVRAREPEELVRLLERRTGILVETGRIRHEGIDTPVFEFRHLSFQEYLAARAIVHRRCPDELAKLGMQGLISAIASRAGTDEEGEAAITESWREPLRLCATICADHDVDAVLTAIVGPDW